MAELEVENYEERAQELLKQPNVVKFIEDKFVYELGTTKKFKNTTFSDEKPPMILDELKLISLHTVRNQNPGSEKIHTIYVVKITPDLKEIMAFLLI